VLRASIRFRRFSMKFQDEEVWTDLYPTSPHAKRRMHRYQKELGELELIASEDDSEAQGGNTRIPNLGLRNIVHFPSPRDLKPGIILKAPKSYSAVSQILFSIGMAVSGPIVMWGFWNLIANIKLFWWVRPVLFCGMFAGCAFSLSFLLVAKNAIMKGLPKKQVREIHIVEKDGQLQLRLLLSSPFGFLKTKQFPMEYEEDKSPKRFIHSSLDGYHHISTPDGLFWIDGESIVMDPRGLLNFVVQPTDKEIFSNYKPVRPREGFFVPVMKRSELMKVPRGILSVLPNGHSKNVTEYLFIASRGVLYALRNKCAKKNLPLHNGHYTEISDNKVLLRCNTCSEAEVNHLRNTLEWKVCPQTDMVLVKLDRGALENPLPAVGSILELYLDFFRTNALRLSQPTLPKSVEDVFILGDFTEYPKYGSSLVSMVDTAKGGLA